METQNKTLLNNVYIASIMKIIVAALVILSVYACSNDTSETIEPNDFEGSFSDFDQTIPLEKLSEEAIKTSILAGSKKESLLGDWQDSKNPDLLIRITPDKYITFVNGKKNWNNPWDLCNYIDYAPENEDDNGNYILVHLEDKSAVFYGQEILNFTENQLDVKIIKSNSATGVLKTFIRT